MAAQRERQAAATTNKELRKVLVELARQWRHLGAGLESRGISIFHEMPSRGIGAPH
jgi:hypothetical protein